MALEYESQQPPRDPRSPSGFRRFEFECFFYGFFLTASPIGVAAPSIPSIPLPCSVRHEVDEACRHEFLV